MRCYINANVLDNEITVSNFSTTAAKESAHASQQFCKAERLRHVVVSSSIEADNHVHLVCTGSQNQDRNSTAGRTDLPSDVQTIHIGQSQVKNNQVNAIKIFKCTPAMIVRTHIVGLSRESTSQGASDRRVIFNEKHCSHGNSIPDFRYFL